MSYRSVVRQFGLALEDERPMQQGIDPVKEVKYGALNRGAELIRSLEAPTKDENHDGKKEKSASLEGRER